MKGQPFFFDNNNFDNDSNKTDQEEDLPPPLEFTAEELEDARKQGFEEGKKSGFEESQNGLSKQILLLAQQIDRTGKQLLLAEDERSKLHEAESISLALCILRKLVPVTYEKLALEEIKKVLNETLKNNKERKNITIEIHPDALAEIENYLTQVDQDTEKKFVLQPDTALRTGECRVLWTDGGILYDTGKMAEKITSILEEALAAQGINSHDIHKGSDTMDSAPLAPDNSALRPAQQNKDENEPLPESNHDTETGDEV